MFVCLSDCYRNYEICPATRIVLKQRPKRNNRVLKERRIVNKWPVDQQQIHFSAALKFALSKLYDKVSYCGNYAACGYWQQKYTFKKIIVYRNNDNRRFHISWQKYVAVFRYCLIHVMCVCDINLIKLPQIIYPTFYVLYPPIRSSPQPATSHPYRNLCQHHSPEFTRNMAFHIPQPHKYHQPHVYSADVTRKDGRPSRT